MSHKTLLFLSADHFHAYTWVNGELSGGQRFADNQDGKEQFAAFLQNHRDPAYLLTDLIEEDFRHEVVPHLRGSDRTALIQRKSEQYYRNTPFRQAVLLQRLKDGRRDDDMLFSGLTNPALISQWLNIMLAQQIPVAGIYSVPNISAPLVKKIPSNHLLLLSWEKNAGLRQTYFNSGLLSFSRLTPMSDGNTLGETVAIEAARTQQYLKSLSLLPPGQVLNVHIICDAHDRRGLEARLNNSSDLNYAYLDIQQMGLRIKSKITFVGSDATMLFLHLIATHAQRSQYAAAEHTHFFQLLQLRRGLHWLSATLTVFCLLWSASSILDGRSLNEDIESLKAQASRLSRQAHQITQSFPSALAHATDMKTAVLMTRKLDSYSPPPQMILMGLSTSLNGFSHIRVDKLSWQASAAPDAMTPNTGVAANAPAQVIMLSGELVEFSGGYRSALNYLDSFQQDLTQRGYTVTALTLPLDISPKGSITTTGVGDNTIKQSHFSLKIIWRPAT